MKHALGTFIAAACLTLAACGTTPKDRTLGGAGVGAATGAAVAAISSLGMFEGLLIGATAGALTGALTDPGQINLGSPPWAKRGTSAAASSASGAKTVKSIQSSLKQRGFYAGPVDGIAGPKTAAAIRAYQREKGLPEDGRATAELASHLERNI